MAQRVIKKEEADALLAESTAFNFSSFEAKAREIVAQAKAEAEAMLNKARGEIEQLRNEVRTQEHEIARREGLEQGHAEGLSQGQEEGRQQAYDQHMAELQEKTAGLSEVVQTIAQELEARRRKLADDAERDLLALSYTIAEKLTHQTFEQRSDAVQQALLQAIELVLSRSAISIFANADDIVAIDEFLPELKKHFNDLGAIEMHPDNELERGSIVVKAGRGEVAMKVTEQLNAIAQDVIGMSALGARSRAISDDSTGA